MKHIIFLLGLLLLAQTAWAENFPVPSGTQGDPVEKWWSTIVSVCAEEYQLDPYWIAGMVKHESWFDERAENIPEKQAYESGAGVWYEQHWGKGLLQMTGPWTAGIPFPRQAEYQYNMPIEAVAAEAPRMDDPFNGEQNLRRGCWYLNALLKHYSGNYLKATAGYRYGFFGTDAGSYGENSSYPKEVQQYRNAYAQSVSVPSVTAPHKTDFSRDRDVPTVVDAETKKGNENTNEITQNTGQVVQAAEDTKTVYFALGVLLTLVIVLSITLLKRKR